MAKREYKDVEDWIVSRGGARMILIVAGIGAAAILAGFFVR